MKNKNVALNNLLWLLKARIFLHGTTSSPHHRGYGVKLGAGLVVPEINFTLPTMDINETTWKVVEATYRTMIEEVLTRAVELEVTDLVVEFETLPDMTNKPEWALGITRISG